ncbi:hypothetical protein BDZ97DRAFT_1661466 [Flammula alnicola]|nr:hypothetical protein BDZ97DRAFT_1661466 [Flammula alnicola]
MSSSKLFTPIMIGTVKLEHRVVLAPLTRLKATPTDNVPIVSLVKIYYSQRASLPGTLLITESTLISPQAGGRPNTPGIWNQEQMKAWKEIVDSVHAKGSFMFVQLRGMGRAAEFSLLESHGLQLVGPSPIPITGRNVPRELTISEIHEYVEWFAQAAKNAIDGAGFDGVELHFANGYLVDQFIQDVSNQRSDEYGGSIERRNKFALDVVDAVVTAIGENRTAVRLSPWSTALDMGMENPIPQFTHLVQSLKNAYPQLAYLHLVEPRISGATDAEEYNDRHTESNDFIRKIWAPRPLITAGGFTRQSAIDRAEKEGVLIAFGRLYISNPDLPARLKYDIALTPPDRRTFYVPGIQKGTEVGYVDYPFAEELKDTDTVKI